MPDGSVMVALTITLVALMLEHLGAAALKLKFEKRSPVTSIVLKGTGARVAATIKDILIVTSVAPA